MSKVQIVGAPQSTFVRTTRIAAEELGVDYDLVATPPHSPEVKAIHPLGKIPVMRHGDAVLCESRAIIAYLESIAEGAALTPSDAVQAARNEQWTSMLLTAFIPNFVGEYLFGYIFPGTEDGSPNRTRIDAALPKAEEHLGILSEALVDTDFLASEVFTVSDAYLLPVLHYLRGLPESGAIIAGRTPLASYLERTDRRASIKATLPPDVSENDRTTGERLLEGTGSTQ